MDRPALTVQLFLVKLQGLGTIRKKPSWRNGLFLVEPGAADVCRGLTLVI